MSSTPWLLFLAVTLLCWFSMHDEYTHFSRCPKILIISFRHISSYFEFFRTAILIFYHYQFFLKEIFHFTLFSIPSNYLNSVPYLAWFYLRWNVQAESTGYLPHPHRRQVGQMLVYSAAFGSWQLCQRTDALSRKAPKLSLMCDVREDKEIHGSKNPKLKDLKTNGSSTNFAEFHEACVVTDKKGFL